MIAYFLNEAKRSITELLASIDGALVQKNSAVLERLLADDFVGAISSGDSF